MLERWRQWRKRFYAGPRDLGIRPYRTRGRYQSPTLTALLWGYTLVVRHFTLAGRVLFLVLGVLLPYSLVSMSMPIHLLSFTVLCLFVLDFAVGYAVFPRLSVSRRITDRMAAGAEVSATYRVANTGRRPGWGLCIDSLPFPTGFRFVEGRPYADCLEPGDECRFSATVACSRRGDYVLPAVRAASGFPFSLWRWGNTCGAGKRVLVYPRFTPLARIDIPVGQRYQRGGIAMSSSIGESMEFLGCREFRDGDDPRHLHWPSWARAGYPVIKEFRQEYLCRTALILDTQRPRRDLVARWAQRPDEVFEAAVSLSAAVADFLSRQDHVVDLFAAGPKVFRFRGGRSLANLDSILDILACLEPQQQAAFDQLASTLIEEIAQISSVVAVFVGWGEDRRRLLTQLLASGVHVRALLISDTPASPADLPDIVATLAAADVLAGRCTAL